jgi:hypothetical protein
LIAFTILGLLVFWCWCFHFGYQLGYLATVTDVLVRVFFLERLVARNLAAFTASAAAMQDGARPTGTGMKGIAK